VLSPELVESAAAEAPDPAATLPEREALARALASLPDDHQLVVHLRLVEGYSFVEVARLTGRSVGSCQMLMLRSARRLRTQLEQAGVRVPA
jgi:DNA-directed RNA polymerase specialized sigma24 family protein